MNYTPLPPHAGITDQELLRSKTDALAPPLDTIFKTFSRIPNPLGRTMVWGAGNPATARLILLGEGPGKVENDFGIPFLGPAGQCLSGVLYSAGISRKDDVFLLNSVLYGPPPDIIKKKPFGPPKTADLFKERDRVVAVIKEIASLASGPIFVVCLGKPAFLQLAAASRLRPAIAANQEFDFDKFLLSPMIDQTVVVSDLPGIHVTAAYHPSYVIRILSKDPNAPIKQHYLSFFKKMRGLLNVSVAQ